MVIDLGQASLAGEAKTKLFGIVLIWNPIEFHKPRLYTETLLGFVIGLGILSAGFGSPFLVFLAAGPKPLSAIFSGSGSILTGISSSSSFLTGSTTTSESELSSSNFNAAA